MFFVIVALEFGRLSQDLFTGLMFARVETRSSMTFLVLHQSLTSTKTLVATFVCAGKMPLFCMHVHMVLQAFSLSKCPGARGPSADQRALFVCTVMRYQAFGIVERLAARVVLTNEGAPVCMCVEVLM